MSKKNKSSEWNFSSGAKKKPCHRGPINVFKSLYCGSEKEFLDAAKEGQMMDTLVPLCAIDGEIWDLGFRGELLYYPVKDFGTLPDDLLSELVSKVIDRLSQGKNVGMFCMGGHGRTGYAASVVLGKLGHEDPIDYLREVYCKKAVESNAQVYHIADVLNKPELIGRYECEKNQLDYYENFMFPGYPASASLVPSEYASERYPGIYCGMCEFFCDERCVLYGCIVDCYNIACGDFIEA